MILPCLFVNTEVIRSKSQGWTEDRKLRCQAPVRSLTQAEPGDQEEDRAAVITRR